MTRRHRARCVRRRRGSIYVVVLGASMFVTVIGVSAVLALRVQGRSAGATQAALHARVAAESLTDLVIYRIANDSDWRDTYTSGQWTDDETVGDVTYSFKLVDEVDGDLEDDPTQSVRLHVRTGVDQTVRVGSVILDEPRNAPNLLTNADMEDGTSNWSGLDECELAGDSAKVHDGDASIYVYDRLGQWAGPNQSVTSELVSGTTYYAEVWVAMSSSPQSVMIALHLNSTGDGDRVFSTSWTGVDTGWTKVSGTLTPTWTGKLKSASWYVKTVWGWQEFNIDDAVLIEGSDPPVETLLPRTGSRRQELND